MVQNVIKGCFRRTLGAQSDFGGPTCRRYSIGAGCHLSLFPLFWPGGKRPRGITTICFLAIHAQQAQNDDYGMSLGLEPQRKSRPPSHLDNSYTPMR
jgi:hypothetical protein